MITTDKLNWYAAYTRVNQELVIKKKLDELGVENYLPQEERVRETPLGRKKIRVILIHGMIFIRTDKATSFSLLNDHLLNIVYLKDREGTSFIDYSGLNRWKISCFYWIFLPMEWKCLIRI